MQLPEVPPEREELQRITMALQRSWLDLHELEKKSRAKLGNENDRAFFFAIQHLDETLMWLDVPRGRIRFTPRE